MNYKEKLKQLQNEKLKNFNKKIIPTAQKVYGITVPELRKLAKEIAAGDYEDYIKNNCDIYFEETMLEGLIIGYVKVNYEKRLALINNFVPKISDWAQCDCVVATFKFIEKNRADFWKHLQKYFASNKEFPKRFAIICMLDYYLVDDYIDDVINLLTNVNSDYYYVNMAVAWALSVCFVKYPEKTLEKFVNCALDDFTFNKTISKCVESFRVSKENKELLKSLKRKSVK